MRETLHNADALPEAGIRTFKFVVMKFAKPHDVVLDRKSTQTFNNKRNKSVYDVAGAISDQELEVMVKLAEELKNNALALLRNLHPELLKGA